MWSWFDGSVYRSCVPRPTAGRRGDWWSPSSQTRCEDRGAPQGESKGPCRLPPSHVPYHLRLLWITDCVLNSVLTRATKRKACPQEGGNGTCCLDNKHTRVHFCRKWRGDCFSSHVFTQDFCPRGNHSNKCSWVVHKIFNLSSGRGSDLHVYKCFDMNEKCVWMTVKPYSV